MPATREQRIDWLAHQAVEVRAELDATLKVKQEEMVGALDDYVAKEGAWLQNPEKRELKQIATDARQAYGNLRTGFTNAWQAAVDQADLDLDQAWAAADAPDFELPTL